MPAGGEKQGEAGSVSYTTKAGSSGSLSLKRWV